MQNSLNAQQLRNLKLHGMAQALHEQQENPSAREMSFDERLGLLIDREVNSRDNGAFQRRLRNAKLKVQASLEEVDYKHPRGLDGRLLRSLADGQWVRDHRVVLITGPTGAGKSYLSSALAHSACRQGFSALYTQMGRLLGDLSLARSDGRYGRMLASLVRVNVLILDDWGLDVLSADQRRILLEVLDDRYERQATIVTSQFPTEVWHENLGDPTLADAILDRVLHGAYRLELKGESLRKARRKLTESKGAGA